MSKRLILGSQSPRRKEILSFFSYPFEQAHPRFAEELVPFEGNAANYAQVISEGKAESLSHLFPKAIVLTADTVVLTQHKIFNKPNSSDEAYRMLTQLNGQWHSVFTSVTASLEDKIFTRCEETKVLFHSLQASELNRYHEAFNGMDKAGGYGIQMAGSIIIKRMEGCFYNVMGLPINSLREVLRQVGIDLWHFLK